MTGARDRLESSNRRRTNNGENAMRKLFGTILALGLLASAPAAADDMAVVKAFYEDLLSNPRGHDLGDRMRKVVAKDWVSTPWSHGGFGAEGMVKTLAGFGKAVPDLNWAPQEMLQDGNRYIVRSIVIGTPKWRAVRH